MSGYIVGSIDVAELALIAFALFFTMLIFWLRREDRREGCGADGVKSRKVGWRIGADKE